MNLMGQWQTVFHTTADIVVRSRWVLLTYVFVVALTGGHLFTRPTGVAFALTWSLIVGAYTTGRGLVLRASFVVPISVRERWLIVLSIPSIVMPLCLGVGTAVGLVLPWARSASDVPQPLGLTMAMVWAYSSIAVLWLPVLDAAVRLRLAPVFDLTGRKVTPRFEGGSLWLVALFGLLLVVMMMPSWLARSLPLHVSDLTGGTGAVAALIGVAAIFAWRFTPADHVPGHRRSPQTLEPQTDPDVRRLRRLDHLTGPARLILPQAMLVGVGTVAALASFAVTMQFFGTYLSTDTDDAPQWFAAAVVGLSFIAPFNSMRRLLRIVPLPVGARVWLPIAGQALNTCAVILGVLLIQQFADTPWPTGAIVEFAVLLFGLASLGAALASRFEIQPGHDGRQFARPLAIGLAMGSANIGADIWRRVVPESTEGLVAVVLGVVALLIAVLLFSRPTVRRRPSASSRPPSSSQPSSQPAASS
ncbi:MAG: hypothetical protein AB7L71_11105 [Vicinamibacterales bacterium]